MNRIVLLNNAICTGGAGTYVLKAKTRIPEGTVLIKVEEIEKIGYDFFIMKFQSS